MSIVITSQLPNTGPVPRQAAIFHQRGFTIIELMVTVMILAVLLSLGVPSFVKLIRDQRVKTAVGDVYASLVFARSEALKRNTFVALCAKNSDGSGCGNTTDWSKGWIVFLDPDDNGYPTLAGEVIKSQDAFSDLALSGFGSGISFQRDGRVKTKNPDNTIPPPFILSSPKDSTVTARCITLDLSGRPNTKVDTDGNPANGC